MGREQESEVTARILAVVLELLAADGYNGVHLRTVASRAHVSLTRIYKLFPTRDELILVALEQWMAEHAYAEVELPVPAESVRDALTRVLRCVFEPWERNPTMLEVYHHARSGPGGQRLDQQGLAAVMPVAVDALRDLDPEYIHDLAIILTNMALALISRFATGTLEITGILPILERTVYRLTADNETASKQRTASHAEGQINASLADVSESLGQMVTRAQPPESHANRA
ncbi:TetR family transcriptional regulator [Nocardia sp. NPDC005978]|uniref:TetR family transcriptional regulator n=1 Tax=Nocardia sp. NPDC005978 TaxID=3156725 RepID=UPI0033A4292A